MKDWLIGNPYGSKKEFKKYFKMCPMDVRKVRLY